MVPWLLPIDAAIVDDDGIDDFDNHNDIEKDNGSFFLIFVMMIFVMMMLCQLNSILSHMFMMSRAIMMLMMIMVLKILILVMDDYEL